MFDILLKIFDGDARKAYKAFSIFIALMENHNERLWRKDEHREICYTLLDALKEEHKGWL